MYQTIPLITTRNQEFMTTVYINETNKSLRFIIKWNPIANYWLMTIIDQATSLYLIDSLPLVRGEINTLSLNILRSFDYLNIGSAYVVPKVVKPSSDSPIDNNLDSEFELVWGDNL